MRFVSFRTEGREACGVLTDDGEAIVEIPNHTMLDFLRISGPHPEEAARFVAATKRKGMRPMPLRSIELLAPLPRPSSLRDGYAFRQHVEAARRGRGLPMIAEFDAFPVFYYSNHQAITGPGDVYVQELHLDRLDFELEVAVVVGREGRNIPLSEADTHIFGYTIMNDWSARALQSQEMKLNLGPAKGKDFATSLGPYLITRDALLQNGQLKPSDLGEVLHARMRAFVNGRQYSDGNAADMSWTFAQIIERASYGVTLYPGDVIGSGTVGTGCFLELNATGVTENVWLNSGDEVLLEVDGLGRLENRIVLSRHPQ